MSEPILYSGHVLSDLHLFAGWSNAAIHLEKMHSAASMSEFFVLNGDIFDFRWSTLSSIDDTAKASVEWLKELAARHPYCTFYYVLGNHDCNEIFVEHLNTTADTMSNLRWHPSHFRIGNLLFMHGDLPIAGKDPFKRVICSTTPGKSDFLRRSYGRLIQMGAHKRLDLIFTESRCARMILRKLPSNGTDLTNGITDIYFGHTHAPFSDYNFNGIIFHNTGSTISNLEFNMLPVKVST